MTACIAGSPTPDKPVDHRDYAKLTVMAQNVLIKLRHALDDKSFRPRYLRKTKDDYMVMYDVVLYLHPATRTLFHIPNIVKLLCGSDEDWHGECIYVAMIVRCMCKGPHRQTCILPPGTGV